jgi:hypothetical protein
MTYSIRSVPNGRLLGSGIRQSTAQQRPAGQALGAAEVVRRLEEAGATLLAMPSSGYSTRLRQMRFDIVHAALEAYGWEAPAMRAPAPDSSAISAMDEAFGWLALIPESQFLLRRILGARALVHPVTGRYLFTWRRLSAAVGADHKSVQRWHGQAVDMVVRGLAASG